MRFLKQFGELLDAADERTSESDLQALTREVAVGAVGAAGKSLELAAGGAADKVKKLDLGLGSGWKELTSQIGTDLKDLGSRLPGQQQTPAEASSAFSPAMSLLSSTVHSSEVAACGSSGRVSWRGDTEAQRQRLGDLEERISELEAREVDRADSRTKLQARYEEVCAQLQACRTMETETKKFEEADKTLVREGGVQAEEAEEEEGDHQAQLSAMRREFLEHQAEADVRAAGLQSDLEVAQEACEALGVQFDFWQQKAQQMLRVRGLDVVPEAIHAEAAGGEEAAAAAAAATRRAEAIAIEEAAVADLQKRQLRKRRDDLAGKLQAQRQEGADLESLLSEVATAADCAAGAADDRRRQTRELTAAVSAAEAQCSAEVSLASLVAERVHNAQACRKGEEQKVAAEVESVSGEGDTGMASEDGHRQTSELRRQADALGRSAETVEQDNCRLESRLRRHRAAAAADLERAIPLLEHGFWSSVDAPLMKAVTLLVRSSCLRKTTAIHLLATYIWLFFLLFWLEKH